MTAARRPDRRSSRRCGSYTHRNRSVGRSTGRTCVDRNRRRKGVPHGHDQRPRTYQRFEQQISDLEAQLTEVRQQLSEAELDQWRARIDDLEVHVHLGSLETRDLLAPLVEDLRNAWLDAREQTAKSASTASDAAGALRNGLDRAMDEIRTAVLQAKATVRR